MKKYNVAILGATGAVGTEFLKLIEEREFPFAELRLLASKRSAGTELTVCGKKYIVQEAKEDSFNGIDIALFAGGSISKEFAPIAVKAGAVVIDNSSTFRMDPEVPLIVPEINPQAILKHKGIIANPNCSTIITYMALAPIYHLSRITAINASTYQAVSGAGMGGIEELSEQVEAIRTGKEVQVKHFPAQIAYNCIAEIGSYTDNGYTTEEMKMLNEGRKIMHDPDLKVTCTCVRVPVFRSHSISVTCVTEKKLDLDEVKRAIDAFDGDVLMDQKVPTPLMTSNQDKVYVGRIRRDLVNENGITLWCCGDQIRKGAAANAVEILKYLEDHK